MSLIMDVLNNLKGRGQPPPDISQRDLEAAQAREEAMRQKQLHSHDLDDIKFLQACEPFNRYFLRRLREKREAADRRFRGDPPSVCDAAQREALRQVVNEYDDMLRLMQTDKQASERILATMPGD